MTDENKLALLLTRAKNLRYNDTNDLDDIIQKTKLHLNRYFPDKPVYSKEISDISFAPTYSFGDSDDSLYRSAWDRGRQKLVNLLDTRIEEYNLILSEKNKSNNQPTPEKQVDKDRLPDKEYQFLVHLFDRNETRVIHDFLIHSDVYLAEDLDHNYQRCYKLGLLVHPEIYKKHLDNLENIKGAIQQRLEEYSGKYIADSRVFPNLNKFQILKNTYVPINTPWADINQDQGHLLELLRSAKETIDYQNIGNASRTLLQKFANHIFDPKKHTTDAKDANGKPIDLGDDKFKNRLHTYIRCELGGHSNKELRDFALNLISTAESSVDLANKLTHDLKAGSMLAESCVISTMTAISIVKLIDK
ncbi:MAG: hypothetical protein HYU69_15645 [Bacteroidetes bacterium]|nr:hypothetical protein [Bacteroidota bacterium]